MDNDVSRLESEVTSSPDSKGWSRKCQVDPEERKGGAAAFSIPIRPGLLRRMAGRAEGPRPGHMPHLASHPSRQGPIERHKPVPTKLRFFGVPSKPAAMCHDRAVGAKEAPIPGQQASTNLSSLPEEGQIPPGPTIWRQKREQQERAAGHNKSH